MSWRKREDGLDRSACAHTISSLEEDRCVLGRQLRVFWPCLQGRPQSLLSPIEVATIQREAGAEKIDSRVSGEQFFQFVEKPLQEVRMA